MAFLSRLGTAAQLSASQTHIPALDGLRAVAILAVIAYHCATLMQVSLQQSPGHLIAFVTEGGWIGVTLFFVLSGYLITGILSDSKETRGYFRNFYARRFLRISPVFYAVLLLVLVVIPRLNMLGLPIDPDSPYWPSFPLFVSNLFVWVNHGWFNYYLAPTWSLAIEEQFYIVWPLAVWYLSRATLGRVCVGLVAVAVAWRVSLLLLGTDSLAIYVATPTHLDALAIGSWLAVRGRDAGGLSAIRPRLVVATLLAAGLLLCVIVFGRQSLLVTGGWMQAVGYTALAVLSAGLLTATLVAPPRAALRRVLESPILRGLGRYSYAMYLLHELCAMLIVRWVQEYPAIPRQVFSILGPAGFYIVFFLVIGGLTATAAWCSWHMLEKHCLRFKRFFVSKPQSLNRATSSVQPLPAFVTSQ